MRCSSLRTHHDCSYVTAASSFDVARRLPPAPAVRRTPGYRARRAPRAGVAAETVLETLAPAGPFFEGLMRVPRSRGFCLQIVGFRKQFFGRLPALAVDAAQSIGVRIHPFPISG